jgi:peptidoglycan/LPS O-acetylase OafA/YrhL
LLQANKWVAILAPLLAACLPTASAAYPHFAKSPEWTVLVIYGGLFIVIITLMIGVAAVPFSFRSKCNPETISRHAAFLSFLLLAAIGTGVICTLLSPSGLLALPIAVGSLSVTCIATLWYYSGNHYR